MSTTFSSYQQWQKLAAAELKEKSLQDLTKVGLEGIEVKPVYGEPDRQNKSEEWPGVFPFTRGPRASMYAGRCWTIRQYAGFSTAEESNRFYREGLRKGQRGLSVAFDLPTHRGYDSDDPQVLGDVGKAGVAIDSVMDMQVLFEGINLGEVSVSMTMNGAVLPILAAFIVAGEESGVAVSKLSGTIQNDILKEFMVRNTFIYPPAPSMRIVADIMAYVTKNMPRFNFISVSGYHIHEAGADLALELALTLANGLEYVGLAVDRGLNIDQVGRQISFFFATGMNFFMEVAKLRAARRMWAHIMRELGATDEAAMTLRTHCQTSGWSLAAADPHNNIIRTTIEAMAAVLGGTQSLHTNSFDEALALPTPFSAHIARNTQLILQHETKIPDVADPLGGSYLVESLTDELENKALEILQKINELGGMTKAIEQGVPQMWINESATKRQALIDSRQELIVGVNAFVQEEYENVPTLKVDNHQVVKAQTAVLARLKKERDQSRVDESLAAITAGAQGNANLLELCVHAMRARATVGEVSQALLSVFGRHVPRVSTAKGVYKAMYKKTGDIESIEALIREFRKSAGRAPRILVAKLGQDGHDRGAKVIAGSFADFGFDVDLSPLFQSPKSIAQQAVDNDVHVVGVSTLAGAHDTLVPELLLELKKLNASHILVIAGGVIPPDDAATLKKAGVALIFGPGTNIVEAATTVINLLRPREFHS
jgi:methylmalonyl-CoA mutase